MEFDPTLINRPQGQRDAAVPRFFIEAQELAFESQQQGRPIFRDVEMVEIIILGDNKTRAVEPVNQGHKDRWPQYYARFKQGVDGGHDGTPLKEWPPLRPSQIQELNALSIYTVEELAAVPDQNLPKMGLGGRVLRDQAVAFLKASKDVGAITSLVSENDALKARVAELEEKFARLTEGRRPKNARPTQSSDMDFSRALADAEAADE